ncbi:MAG: hypothetical protein ACYCVO_16295, partial [Acidimicrobiales bacterium]
CASLVDRRASTGRLVQERTPVRITDPRMQQETPLCPEPVGLMVGVEVAVIVSVVGAAAGLGFVAMAFTLNAGVNVPSVTVDADVFHVGVTATVPIAPAVL